MCGIVGYWSLNGASEAVGKSMADRIRHRGPDDAGVWLSPDRDLVLAHRRLAIIDLSSSGHQPMLSACGRFTLVYNGEIYNHLSIRKELSDVGAQPEWRGHSDTETLLVAVCQWGLRETLQRLNGMFAFALWDNKERKLFLARDRMGEKPLYYGYCGNSFVFGSELKSFKAHPDWDGEINRDALASYLRHSYVPTPHSIYRKINKLPAAHFLEIADAGRTISEPVCYWDLASVVERAQPDRQGTSQEYIEELDALMRESIGMRMMSDVPLGAFLSGGIDSTSIVALMQAQSSRPVKTFSIGFNEAAYNEATYAKSVARFLGTDHTELYVSSEEAMDVIPQLPSIWDEPFSDASQIPTYLVSRLAREQVTVSLSGDGGDELFCGYNRYNQGYRAWKLLKGLPLPVRQALSSSLLAISGRPTERMMRLLPKRFQIEHLADRLPKLADVIREATGESYYRNLVSHSKNPEALVVGSSEAETMFTNNAGFPAFADMREKMMYIDSLTYLPDDILAKVDRASMAVSLESRVPFLDHRLVEFSWKLPMSLKYQEGKGKWILREVLYKYVPKDMMERPKMGFGVPIEHWLQGPLRDWAESLLSEERLAREGYLNPEPIRRMWQENQSGKRRWHYHLWDVLMFQAWLENEVKN